MKKSTTKQVAEFFDVNPRTIRRWGSKGCPQVGRDQWNLKDVFLWWKKRTIFNPFDVTLEPANIADYVATDEDLKRAAFDLDDL